MIIRRAIPLDATAIAEVHVASWLETYHGIVPQSHLDNLSISKREKIWKDAIEQGQFVLVAESDGKIVGFGDGGKFRGTQANVLGELFAIYVLALHQRKGIGRALFEGVQDFLRERRLRPFGVWVLAENPACGFYEAMGGNALDEKWEVIGGVTLREVLFVYE